MNIRSLNRHRSTFARGGVATFATVALAGLAYPGPAGAKPDRVDGVRARIERGTLEVKGDAHGTALALRLAKNDPSRLQVDVGDDGTADFTFARSSVSAIDVRMGPGDDSVRVDDSNGAFTDSIPTTIDGGPGGDNLTGGAGAETFIGGPGNDTVTGGKGNDTAYLGSGDDTFVWNPGDASDSIEGQAGTDTMLFNGANANENVTLTANGGRLKFFRNVGTVTMDTDGVETVDFNALGGSDNVTVNDLTGTDVRKVNVDLAGTLGGAAGDGALDNVTVTGTNGNDKINIAGSGSGADVTGLPAAVSVVHPDRADTLSVNTLAGKDAVSAAGATGMQVLVNGTLI